MDVHFGSGPDEETVQVVCGLRGRAPTGGGPRSRTSVGKVTVGGLPGYLKFRDPVRSEERRVVE